MSGEAFALSLILASGLAIPATWLLAFLVDPWAGEDPLDYIHMIIYFGDEAP